MTLFTKSSFFNTGSQLQNSINGVTPAKAGVQKFLKRLDFRFRGNDNLGLLQLAPGSYYISQGKTQLKKGNPIAKVKLPAHRAGLAGCAPGRHIGENLRPRIP